MEFIWSVMDKKGSQIIVYIFILHIPGAGIGDLQCGWCISANIVIRLIYEHI